MIFMSQKQQNKNIKSNTIERFDLIFLKIIFNRLGDFV